MPKSKLNVRFLLLVLGALAAVNVVVTVDEQRRPSFHLGVEWLAVGVAVVIVARRRNLFAGLLAAAVLTAAIRFVGG